MKHLLEFCTSDSQRDKVEALTKFGTNAKAAQALGINQSNVSRTIRILKEKAARHGVSPEADINHRVMEGFAINKVSEFINKNGEVNRWISSSRERENLTELLEGFKEGLKDEFEGLHKPIKAPEKNNEDLMACYLIGDQHYGMYAHALETGVENWDTDIADKVLMKGFDKLCSRTTDAHYGMLVNVGDFFHANDSKSETGAGTKVDTDGRLGRTIRMAGQLFQHIINRMLEAHQEVIILNARGNHDPDAALWLNEMLRMYYKSDPRVKVLDNLNKFVWHKFGKNLIVTHHGDKLKAERAYQSITMNLSEEWGSTKHRFLWMGHIHHKQAMEIGGMLCESFNVLAPPDAWHAGSGYGSSRSMTCVMLHRDNGVDCRFMANIDELRG